MAYKLVLTKTFERNLKKLDRAVAKHILRQVQRLESDQRQIVKLRYTPKNLVGLCKYRVGEWRVLLWVDDSLEEITLYAVAHRKNIYQSL